jgi:hypothetical protein
MDKTRLDQLKDLKNNQKAKIKSKSFKTLSTKEKDELLETICRMLGLIE